MKIGDSVYVLGKKEFRYGPIRHSYDSGPYGGSASYPSISVFKSYVSKVKIKKIVVEEGRVTYCCSENEYWTKEYKESDVFRDIISCKKKAEVNNKKILKDIQGYYVSLAKKMNQTINEFGRL